MIRSIPNTESSPHQVSCYFLSTVQLHEQDEDVTSSDSVTESLENLIDHKDIRPETEQFVHDQLKYQQEISSIVKKLETHKFIFSVDPQKVWTFSDGKEGWFYQVDHKIMFDSDTPMNKKDIKEIYGQVFDVKPKDLKILDLQCHKVTT